MDWADVLFKQRPLLEPKSNSKLPEWQMGQIPQAVPTVVVGNSFCHRCKWASVSWDVTFAYHSLLREKEAFFITADDRILFFCLSRFAVRRYLYFCRKKPLLNMCGVSFLSTMSINSFDDKWLSLVNFQALYKETESKCFGTRIINFWSVLSCLSRFISFLWRHL